MQVIVYKHNEGIAIVLPTQEFLETNTIEDCANKDVPKGTTYKIVNASEFPKESAFRDAWRYDEKFYYDMDKAKEVAHEHRRYQRSLEFAPLDDLVAKRIPSMPYEEIEAKRQEIRDKYDALQKDIDAASTIEEYMALLF